MNSKIPIKADTAKGMIDSRLEKRASLNAE